MTAEHGNDRSRGVSADELQHLRDGNRLLRVIVDLTEAPGLNEEYRRKMATLGVGHAIEVADYFLKLSDRLLRP